MVQKESAYSTRWFPLSQLTVDIQDQMVGLYLAVYDGTCSEIFLQDLQAKDGALLLYYGETLVGFTTLQIYLRQWQGQPIRVVYSGDTVVERNHWGQHALALDWISLMGQLQRQHPEESLIWLLLVKGHRTFLYLPVFAQNYWPNPQQDCSEFKPLADQLAGERFPDFYNPTTGVVEFPTSRGHLKSELAEPAPHQLRKPEVEFFLQRNPGFRQGHELVCLCPIEESNMKPLARRAFLAARPDQSLPF